MILVFMFSVPEDAEMIVVRMPGSVIWLDKSAIVHNSLSKIFLEWVGQISVLSMPIYWRMGRAQVCVRTNVIFDDGASGRGRAYLARLSAEVVKATATIFRVVAGKIVATYFFNVGSRPYPVTMCIDVNGAKAWLNGIYERKFDG
jgi:hypothetical protein